MRNILVLPALTWLVFGLAGCSTLPVGGDPTLSSTQRDQVQRDMNRPPIEADASYESVTVESDLPVPLALFSKWFAQIGAPQFESFLIGTQAVPGVVRTEPLIGTWNTPGDRRRIVLADGNSAVEEIIQDRTPQIFQYEVWNLTNTTGRYTSYAVGKFRSYVHGEFRQFMETALARMRAQALADLTSK